MMQKSALLTLFLLLNLTTIRFAAQCVQGVPGSGCPPASALAMPGAVPGQNELPMNVAAHIDLQMNGLFTSAAGVVPAIQKQLQ